MKRSALTFPGFVAVLLAVPSGANAAWGVNQPIPDGTGTGLADTQSLVFTNAPIHSVTVEISLTPTAAGSWMGDLYLYIMKEDRLAVLLNRPGRRDGNDAGYGDGGPVTITFDALAPHDIHDYRLPLTGSHDLPLAGPLTGTWQPDGRAVDPAVVRSSTTRTAGLEVFAGANPSGDWTIFVADVEQGGMMLFESWNLVITQVPEPSAPALMGLGVLAVLGVRSARRRRR
ncbi:MAG: PEP-CTERM sorting domain-containing protein [Limisphaerales bacterium]